MLKQNQKEQQFQAADLLACQLDWENQNEGRGTLSQHWDLLNRKICSQGFGGAILSLLEQSFLAMWVIQNPPAENFAFLKNSVGVLSAFLCSDVHQRVTRHTLAGLDGHD